jgi:redox-sensitive bicupin YhaK (pirin superfamily)
MLLLVGAQWVTTGQGCLHAENGGQEGMMETELWLLPW